MKRSKRNVVTIRLRLEQDDPRFDLVAKRLTQLEHVIELLEARLGARRPKKKSPEVPE